MSVEQQPDRTARPLPPTDAADPDRLGPRHADDPRPGPPPPDESDTDAPSSREAPSVGRPHRAALRRFGLALLVTLPLFAMWSLTTAMFGSPDETVHMVRAQSFAVLDLSQPYTTDGLPIDAVECFRFRPEVSAACQDLTWGEPGTQLRVPTGDYPPVYHLVAAVPAVFTSGLLGAYVMRIWMAAACAALFAWALTIATRPGSGPWPLVGTMVAVTPMVAFTAGTVNTSGMTAAGTALFTVALLATVRRRHETPRALEPDGSAQLGETTRTVEPEGSARLGGSAPARDDVDPVGTPDRRLMAALAVGAIVLVASRRDGLLWFAIVLFVTSPLLPWRAWSSSLVDSIRRRRTTIAAVAIAVALLAVAALRWFGPTAQRFLRNFSDGLGGGTLDVVRSVQVYLSHLIGQFGWLDTPIGFESLFVVFALAGFLLVAALSTAPPRYAIATVLGIVALLAVPVLFGLVRFPYLQGRYLIPIWVGLAVVAGEALGRGDLSRRAARRAVPIVLGLWLVVHVFALVTNLRRYAVGRFGPWNVVTDPEWSPPMMSNGVALLLIVVAGAAAAVGGVLLVRAVGSSREERAT